MSDEEMKAELERLRDENASLKKGAATGITMKVSEKGGLSVYGMGRFPITLYKEQWLKLMDMSDAIRSFIEANDAALRERQEMDEPTVLVAMRQMSQVWEQLFPIEQHRIVRLLIERVQLHEDGLDIIWCDDSWQRFCRERGRQPFVAEQREIVAEEIA